MNPVITPLRMRYETNFVRSAITPDAMVTAVAAKTAWKKNVVATLSPPSAGIVTSPVVTQPRCNRPIPKRLISRVIAEIGLGLSSVAPTPLCATATAAVISGRTPADALDDALATLEREVQPIDDVRSNARYRRAIAVALLRDVLEALARGESPAPAIA